MSQRAGLYIHIPFCLTRCGYCDFNTYAGLGHLAIGYVEALLAEAEMVAPQWDRMAFASAFLGGGTPTTLPAETIGRLLGRLRELFDVPLDAEITSEANPDTVDVSYLSELRGAGINRLSIGVQSFDPATLDALERIHGPDSARAAYRSARSAGHQNVNLDLIYGASGETIESWSRTLDEAVALGPGHLSCYALTIELATALGRKVAAGLIPPPDPDLQADMYEMACDVLNEAGYQHYEVSNWAKPGRRCIHNLGYWEGRPYLGLGAGAHSYRDGRRWWNVRPPQQYMAMVSSGQIPVGGGEQLTDGEQGTERLLLGLRTAEGVPFEWADTSRAKQLIADGLALRRNGHLALTDRGMFLASEVALELAD
jgi:putative oxygen-independent coproporphyrinogen III oxidase